jgi:hypothetical protein
MRRLLFVVIAVAACGDKKSDPPAPSPTKAGSAAPRPDPEPAPTTPAADGSAEVIHKLDKATAQGFQSGHLAIGGGFVYWIESPRIDKAGLGKSVVRRKPVTGGEPENIYGPSRIFGIAADGDNLYMLSTNVLARPHGGGEPKQIAAGQWINIVPGDKFLWIATRKKAALVPKAGGDLEEVWQGNTKLEVAADGDRFLVVDVGLASQNQATRPITVYAPGAKPTELANLPEPRGYIGVAGDFVYFTGRGETFWRIDKTKGGKAEAVGDPAKVGIGGFTIRDGKLVGMTFTGKWSVGKVDLATGAHTKLDSTGEMVQSLHADDKHVYYLAPYEVRRVAL